MSKQTTPKSIFNLRFWLFSIRKTVGLLSGSFWFIPSIMIISALLLGYFLPTLEFSHITSFISENRLGVTTASSALQIVQVIASSTITITSIAFSMTIVALVMASNQFGPRLLKNFMRNKSTQCVLGIFTATFVFCLVIINQINTSEEVSYYPILSVLIALILAIVCVFTLIFFIHHVATSIRADTVVKQTAHALMDDMRTLQARHKGVVALPSLIDLDQYKAKQNITAKCDGYIQAIEYQQIIELAKANDGIIEMQCRAGEYIVPGALVATFYCDQINVNNIDINESLVIGEERTALQDPLFAVNQLVEMALRALSPSLDDAFTATNCIDRLASALASFDSSTLPQTTLLDQQNTVRVLSKDLMFEDIFEGAFVQIRQSSSAHPFVTLHLLKTFVLLIESSNHAQYMKSAVQKQVQAIKESTNTQTSISNSVDKKAYDKLMGTLEEHC